MRSSNQKYCTTVLTRSFRGKPMSIGLAVLMHGGEGVTEQAVVRRIHRLKWSFEKAVVTPIQEPHRRRNVHSPQLD